MKLTFVITLRYFPLTHIYIPQCTTHIMYIWTQMSSITSIRRACRPLTSDSKRSGARLCLDGDSSEYFCSIVRVTIQTSNTLPVFIPLVAIQNNQTLPVFRPNTAPHQLAHNMTIYTVSLTYTYQNINYTSTKCVYYNPKDKTAPIPAPPSLTQDF